MRRNLKRFGCAILCTCLLMINGPAPMSYAGNTEQYATATDAAATDVAYVDVPEEGETAACPATGTDAEDCYAESATPGDALLAASPDVPEEGYKLEINSQADWDNLFNHTSGDGSGWSSSGTSATYIENTNPVTIILNSDITLSADTTLTIPPIDSVQKDFLLFGNGHSIHMNGYAFMSTTANTMTITDTTFESGTLKVQGHNLFHCVNNVFNESLTELYTSSATERTSISNCTFVNCPDTCVSSKNAPCPVTFSHCDMDGCGLLFESQNQCLVTFENITAENCTGSVLGQTARSGYIIETISGCELTTSTPGITAIEHKNGAVKEMKDCKITGFDTGISLTNCTAAPAYGIDTITIKDTEITDCITGLYTDYLNGYENAMIFNLTMKARESASGTTGYKAVGTLTNKQFYSVDYDFNKMPQIKSCKITGFDTGINIDRCNAVVSDCQITDCIAGIDITGSIIVAITDTTLKSRASAPESSDNAGVTTGSYATCWLLDCDIDDFYVGSDLSASSNTTIIGCRYKNKTKNLMCPNYTTSVYNTSFTGGETSVIVSRGDAYFYDCVVDGTPAVTKAGFSVEAGASNLYIYSLERPYNSPRSGDVYAEIKNNSDRPVTGGKSEIFNCETGIDAKYNVNIADTHVHDCVTGMNLTGGTNHTSYGNNLIEDCTDGMIVSSLYKYKAPSGSSSPEFTDIHTDTIRNCSNNGLAIGYITGPDEWDNRMEIYNCGNYGINVTGNISNVTFEVHDCKTGIYISDTSGSAIFGNKTTIYNSQEWNVYDNNTSGQFIIQGQDGKLIGGKLGNVYSKKQAIIGVTNLYSDDSVYYLGTADMRYTLNANTIHGTVVFDTVDSGYILGRRIAGLNADVTSQMFAKKEGFVISSEKEGTTTYAIFAAGCNVSYDVTTNGGDTFHDGSEAIRDGNQTQSNTDGSLTRISYLDGSDIDLSYTASKTGYEFVGWNTNPDATVGLDSLTASRKDITLYAIYKKTAYVNYHTYDAASDYKTDITFYNNEEEKESSLAAYNAGGDNTFVGYVLDEDATISSADDVMGVGDTITITASTDDTDVYCVYEKQGQLNYLKKDGTILSAESDTVYEIGSDDKKFEYTVRAGEPAEGFTFKEWKDAAGNSFAAGSIISTEDNLIVLTPVYEKNEEPATEEPTTEAPTTETPEPEAPIIQPPTTEASTQTPSGPKTGDSAAPIAVMILGFLSLIGIAGLSMKFKKKN